MNGQVTARANPCSKLLPLLFELVISLATQVMVSNYYSMGIHVVVPSIPRKIRRHHMIVRSNYSNK